MGNIEETSYRTSDVEVLVRENVSNLYNTNSKLQKYI